MKKMKYSIPSVYCLLLPFLLLFSSCKDYMNPYQDINVTDDKLLDDWYEYRSMEMGMYALQQNLAVQLVVLGELRADLLTITDNADADLAEIYNFNVSKDNKYASPRNFYKLIASCNNLIRKIETNHPEVKDNSRPISNYDRLYGEVLCMRAWAYFNAVRIYGKVPFINESLTEIEEIENFIESTQVYNVSDTLVRQLFDTRRVVDYFTKDLLTKVKYNEKEFIVGVNHSINIDDKSWYVNTWNPQAMRTLLGLMYFTDQNYEEAYKYFYSIINNESTDFRYALDYTFSDDNWKNIFKGIDLREHIYVIPFNKSELQQNDFQRLFEARSPHDYMLKPSKKAIFYWETIWNNFVYIYNNNEQNGSNPVNPLLTKINVKESNSFIPPMSVGDFYRGYHVSYAYMQNGVMVPDSIIKKMLLFKSKGKFSDAALLIENADTVVWKYSIGKDEKTDVFMQDAQLILYRAAGIHLWIAELLATNNAGGENEATAIQYLNDGSYSQSQEPLGVRGRVGFGGDNTSVHGRKRLDTNDAEELGLNEYYIRDPYNNNVIPPYYIDISNSITQRNFIEEKIIEEKARELAWEGERFYDLMRVAKRRNDASFLADRVSAKYPTEDQQRIKNYLMNMDNWYIKIFE